MKLFYLLIIGFLLASCANNLPLKVDGNEYSVNINYFNRSKGSEGAAEEAEKHCAKYGRHAQFAGTVNYNESVYNCIK